MPEALAFLCPVDPATTPAVRERDPRAPAYALESVRRTRQLAVHDDSSAVASERVAYASRAASSYASWVATCVV